MDNLNIGVAFIAGLLSFLSPCVLPMVPGYITFLTGLSLEELESGDTEKRTIFAAGISSVFFVIGFSFVFVGMGASATFLGVFLRENLPLLIKIAGAVLILFGLHMAGIFRIKALYRERKIQLGKLKPGLVSCLIAGFAFGFGWTPCIGPILAGILTLAATQETMLQGIMLLGVYSLGLGIPFILTGFAIGFFMKFFKKYRRFIRAGEIVAGIFLILMGLLIFTDNLSFLLKYVPETFYELAK
jgi:cytochrome c-type biogenesis protein